MGPGAEPQRESQPRPPTVDELLAAAARCAPVAPDAAANALAAFRAARDEGALDLPTRSADDWRQPTPPRKRGTWIKAGLGTLVAGVMLGGGAMAAGAIPVPFGESPAEGPRPTPSVSPSGPAAASESTTPRATGLPATAPGAVHPSTAEDQAAHCRAYEAAEANARAGSGRSLDSAVRERLEAAAGGPDAVEAYCARLSVDRPSDPSANLPTSKPEKNTDAPRPTAGVSKGGTDKGSVPDPKRQ
ncbi:hypothetical protein GCM10010381_07320 [Streptomyces xantholiticus]|nr:hypothetical protein GCM10010381_07320 [Streptomyces xantholiticus]